MSGWVRFENTMPENLKVAPVSDKAFRLWVHAVCYCSRAQTDGLVPKRLANALSSSATTRVVAELVDAGLFEPVTDGYRVHDYLEHNPSRKRIAEMKDAARERTQRWRGSAGDDVVTHHTDRDSDVTSHARDLSVSVPTPSCSNDEGQPRPGRSPSKRADQHEPPTALPGELHRTAHSALQILAAVQTERGGDVPTIRGVGLAILRSPNRDFLRVAHELEHWALAGSGQRKPVKDWARTFGTFLERTPEGSPVRLAASNGQTVSRSAAVERMDAWRNAPEYQRGGEAG